MNISEVDPNNISRNLGSYNPQVYMKDRFETLKTHLKDIYIASPFSFDLVFSSSQVRPMWIAPPKDGGESDTWTIYVADKFIENLFKYLFMISRSATKILGNAFTTPPIVQKASSACIELDKILNVLLPSTELRGFHRLFLFKAMAQTAVDYLLYHEISHAIRGHLRWIQAIKRNTGELPDVASLTACEVHADSFAMQKLLDRRPLEILWEILPFIEFEDKYGSGIRHAAFTQYVVCSIWELKPETAFLRFEDHPGRSPPVAFRNLHSALITASRPEWPEAKRFDAIFEIMNEAKHLNMIIRRCPEVFEPLLKSQEFEISKIKPWLDSMTETAERLQPEWDRYGINIASH